EPGAILEVNTGLHDFATTALDPAIHVLNARRTYIAGIDIRPMGQAGGVAILVEDSPRTIISKNKITDHQFGVLLEASNYVYILRNELSGTPLWQTGEAPFATGILTMKGDNAVVSGNETAGFFIGLWACSRYGRVTGNESFGNFLGIILCTATPGAWQLPSGEFSGSDFSAFRTRMYFNNSHDNGDVNFQAIDGANNNLVALNQAANAGRIDYEFATETDRYGLPFTLPETFDNRALISTEDTFVDCGRDNRIFGGDETPATEASCF
ncbi:MAG: right-handed parallel beta-helix repeat-containing protein, partial [Bacteroidota bacterium]